MPGQTATITAEAEGKTASCLVEVKPFDIRGEWEYFPQSANRYSKLSFNGGISGGEVYSTTFERSYGHYSVAVDSVYFGEWDNYYGPCVWPTSIRYLKRRFSGYFTTIHNIVGIEETWVQYCNSTSWTLVSTGPANLRRIR